ncbi:MAG: TIGR01777 family oxidoreductase [Acidobacteriota bacterium]|nr:TIGR01777 family oxidoreductase [Acidobacteriota bacterium]
MTSLNIVASGVGGLLGRALVKRLERDGHRVTRLVRPSSAGEGDNQSAWNPGEGEIDSSILEGADAVFCLNGANLADQRWTARYKRILIDSRIQPTGLLARTIAGLENKPKVFLVASGIAVYGDRGNDWVTEETGHGEGFLVKLAQDWEGAAQPARDAGVRVVNMRIGPVLSADGGALDKMLLPFKLGLGGQLGNGRQYMPWIAMVDCVEAMVYCMEQDSLDGPVNLASPNPVTNAVFTRALGKTLGRPTFLPVPAFALRFGFGQMADEALLASCRAKPAKLLDAGFHFAYPEVHDALAQQLN